nr:cytochrome c oxidase subunit II [Ceratocombus sp. HL-2012]
MSTWSQIMLQDAISPNMEQLTFFHDHTMMILIMITLMVLYMMISMMWNKIINRNLLEGHAIEFTWTILPAVILVFIAMPSLQILYIMDEIKNPMMTIKSIGHQWFWSYEYSDFKNIEFESYMKTQNNNLHRLLEVDNRVILPMKIQIRILITSMDVIHSWTVPSMGVKMDATPGRLNQTSFLSNQTGILYGQCSEICGANHSFMPIVVEIINMNEFSKWINDY